MEDGRHVGGLRVGGPDLEGGLERGDGRSGQRGRCRVEDEAARRPMSAEREGAAAEAGGAVRAGLGRERPLKIISDRVALGRRMQRGRAAEQPTVAQPRAVGDRLADLAPDDVCALGQPRSGDVDERVAQDGARRWAQLAEARGLKKGEVGREVLLRVEAHRERRRGIRRRDAEHGALLRQVGPGQVNFVRRGVAEEAARREATAEVCAVNEDSGGARAGASQRREPAYYRHRLKGESHTVGREVLAVERELERSREAGGGCRRRHRRRDAREDGLATDRRKHRTDQRGAEAAGVVVRESDAAAEALAVHANHRAAFDGAGSGKQRGDSERRVVPVRQRSCRRELLAVERQLQRHRTGGPFARHSAGSADNATRRRDVCGGCGHAAVELAEEVGAVRMEMLSLKYETGAARGGAKVWAHSHHRWCGIVREPSRVRL